MKELAGLPKAYEVAMSLDVAPLRAAIEEAAARCAVMVGSGGSFSVASFAAYLHQLNTGRLAIASTPLDYMTLPLRDAATICFSASGSNKDICAAFDEAAQREAKPLIGLVMRESSPLHELASHYRYTHIVSASSEHLSDGFLAVASLLGSSILLVRAYRTLIGNKTELPATLSGLLAATTDVAMEDIIPRVEHALYPTTTSLLHSSSLKPAAVDIESRFVEAALGNVHGTDLRNFGHGRHHWFAKRETETGIVALVGDEQGLLATRTLELLPKSVPIARINFRGPKDEQALAGLVISLHLAAAAGRLRGIDPAKPGVPEFGRKLYHLAPPKRRKAHQSEITETAVWRKKVAAGLKTTEQHTELRTLCQRGIERLQDSSFIGIVFDYDGTLCETRSRFEPVSAPIADCLNRLLQKGAILGIATGRGDSAAERIRATVHEKYWSNIVVGFYNGAVIRCLNDRLPPRSAPGPEILELETVFRRSRQFAGCTFRTNCNQIAISMPPLEEPVASVRAAAAMIDHAGMVAKVNCSSHSIDVTFGNVGKTAVVDAIREMTELPSNAPILRLGDKGRWPGNDVELLDDPFGLSVDEVSPSMEACWGLSPRGILGVQATLYYLDRINWKHGAGFISFD